MSIATLIDPVLAKRQARAAARNAERAARDVFIQAQFVVLGTQFDTLLREALGLHSGFTLTATPVSYVVQGRTFNTLNVNTWRAAATFNGAPPQAVNFTPRLDFREPDQFGLIECALDFPYAPLRSRADLTARALLERGIRLSGKASASLLLPLQPDQLVELRSQDLEDAFGVWWLRS
jgi:hypothetical protein